MELSYQLKESNFLQHQLFHATHSPIIRKRRFRNKFIFPMFYILMGLFLTFLHSDILGYIFVVLGICWYLFYPIYERGAYVKHYKKFIAENFGDSIEETVHLTLLEDHLILKQRTSEAKIDYKELKEIVEIPNEVLIKIGNANAIIIPKSEIKDYPALEKRLENIADAFQIEFLDYQQWKWK